MVNEAAEFTQSEFLEVAARYAEEIGRSEDPQDILLRYALDYTEDPKATVSNVVWLLRRQNREYSQEAIEEFLRANAETQAAARAKKIAPASSISAQSAKPAKESKGQPKPSFPPGWSAGRIINYLRSRDQFRELEECRQLLQDVAFLRSVRLVSPQRVSAHLLARLLNITPANLDGIEKGAIPVIPEICDNLIEIFGFHERAAEEFRNRAGMEATARAQSTQLVIPTEAKQTSRGSATAAAPEPEQSLFGSSLFERMRDNLRDLLATDGPVYMGDGVTELWPTQRELLEQCSTFLDTPVGEQIPGLEGEHIKRGQFLEALSATGTGKTDSFARLATIMNKGIRAPVLILTPRQLLNAQTKERFCRLHGIDEKDIMIWDSNQPVRERTRLFQQNPPPTYLIASYQSLFNLITEHQLDFTTAGSRYYRPLVILDEVPEAIGSETGNLIRDTFIDKVLVAGFAAVDAGAAAALFRGQASIYNLDIAEGIERDVLCQKLETGIIDVPLDDDVESAAMLARIRAVSGDQEQDPLDTGMFARNRRVVSAAVDFHLGYHDKNAGYVRHRPTLFFIDGINAAAQGSRIFNERARELGLAARAAYVSSDECLFVDYDEDGNVTRLSKNRNEILRMLDTGEIQAVWNDRLVGIGIDFPNLSVCYHVGHPHSLYRLAQEMGRIARKNDGNKIALAFNVCASGTDSYLYEDVLRGTEVESRQRQERDESSVSRSPSGGIKCEDMPYMLVPNIRVYTSRSDRQENSPVWTPPQQQTHRPGAERPHITESERDAAVAQELSMATERRRVIADAEQQLRERAASAAGENIMQSNTIAEFASLLPAYTGLSMRELDRRIGHSRYIDTLATLKNQGTYSQEIIMPFLRQHYPELAEHFERIASQSISLPVARLMATDNTPEFFRILRNAHPLAAKASFYNAVDTSRYAYHSLTRKNHVPLENTIARFEIYLRQQTGSDELYQHLVSIRDDEIRKRAAVPSDVSIAPDVFLETRSVPEFLTLLRDAHPANLRHGSPGSRMSFFDEVNLSPESYREAALGQYLPTERAIARFRAYLKQVTGSDDAYQHLLRLRNEAKPQNYAIAREARRKAALIEPARDFLDAWDNKTEQIAVDKRSGMLMQKVRQARGMSLRELADFFRSRGIVCDPSKIALWEKGGFPRYDPEAVIEGYVALASEIGQQVEEDRQRVARRAQQVGQELTGEIERRKDWYRRPRGHHGIAELGAAIVMALAPHGGLAYPSQAAPAHVKVRTPPERDISATPPSKLGNMTGTGINKAWKLANGARLTIQTVKLSPGSSGPTPLPSLITYDGDIPEHNLLASGNAAVSGINNTNLPSSSISDVSVHSAFVSSPKPIYDENKCRTILGGHSKPATKRRR
jgi:superfamily II DNA or RNA helicase